MVESQFLPDCVISLEDDRGNRNETLLNRFIKQFDPELSADKLNKAEGENEDIVSATCTCMLGCSGVTIIQYRLRRHIPPRFFT